MQIFGRSHFHDYNHNLRRVSLAELIDQQMLLKRRQSFRATLVGDPFAPRPALSASQVGPLPGPAVVRAAEIADAGY